MESVPWNDLIADFGNTHILQTSQWAEFKSSHGWSSHKLLWYEDGRGSITSSNYKDDTRVTGKVVGAASILQRRYIAAWLPVTMNILYVPKGPLLDWDNRTLRGKILTDLGMLARQSQSIFIKIDPDVQIGTGQMEAKEIRGDSGVELIEPSTGQALLDELERSGWVFSTEQVQFRNTVLIDLLQTEQTLLENMKQKTRYNIRLAERKGVGVRVGSNADFQGLFQMYAETSVRDGFVIRSQDYYLDLWGAFYKAGMAEPLIAEVDGVVVAAVILFYFGDKSWYLYGMSNQAAREKMPNYLLQWEAIKRAKSKGCAIYDLWGAPDEFVESDPLWGVYRFKEGFNGQVVRHIGAWDLPVSRSGYYFYGRVLPRLLSVMRRRGQAHTRQIAGA